MTFSVWSGKHRDHFGGAGSFFRGAECLEKPPYYQERGTYSVSYRGLQ
jgi:hypothetical protein